MNIRSISQLLVSVLFVVSTVFSQPATDTQRPAMAQDPDPALVTKAQQGDTAAQRKLGDYYFNKKDNANGLKWLLKAADGGNADAQNALGFRYQSGNGVPNDVEEARKWLRKSADQDFKFAMNNHCVSYTNPMDIFKGANPPTEPLPTTGASKEDMTEAFTWCSKAAGSGMLASQYRLGLLYAKSSAHVKPDYEQSYFWLNVRNAPQGLREAVGKQLPEEKRDEIKKLARAWKEGTPPPFSPARPR